MKSNNRSWRRNALSVVIGGLSLIAITSHAGTPQPPGLLSTLPGKSQAKLPAQAIAGRSRAVRINHSRLRSGRIFLDLPGGVSLEAVRDMQQELGDNRFAWVGHASGNRKDRVVIGVSGDAVAATFAYKGKLFKLEPRPDGSHIISEVSTEDPAPELDPVPVADLSGSGTDAAVTSASADGASVIDVLVAYTPRVESAYGAAGTDALIIQAVAEANQAYAKSGINTSLNLVQSVRTEYVESGNMSTDLSRLRSTTDGYMDELHALRDGYGADLVSLIEHEPAYCGSAYRMTTLSAGFASSGFSVVHRTCATGYYSFAHEIGHNQGAHHDPANASGGIYAYSYGHQDPNGAFRTVMAYNCSGGCKRVDHFSNPNIYRNELPTGTANAEDNARTINNTAATVASFRQLPAENPPSGPTGLSGSAVSHSEIQLNWADNASDEDGFKLERALDGGNFSQVASLPGNTTSYLDSNLIADTLYTYRVRAWNSAGNSTYSGQAVIATDTAPPQTDQVAKSDVPVAGSLTGTYQQTWNDDGNNQSIRERQSGGKPRNRYGYLEHKWTFQVQPGNAVFLFTDAQTTASNESFTFAYSTNNSQFIDMFTIDSESPGAQQFTLPSSLSGTIYVRVKDNVRKSGDTTSHELKVDHILIRSENGTDMPAPAAPAALAASASGASKIALSWSDNSDSEYGFLVQRRTDDTTAWTDAGSTGSNSTSFTDSNLAPSTVYHYRVQAFNGAGSSAFSNSASATTAEQSVASIQLGASGYKVKGQQRADLSWSGAQTSSVDIYRNGARVIAGTSNDGSYTDNINQKGGGNYSYEICQAGSSTCSNSVNVGF